MDTIDLSDVLPLDVIDHEILKPGGTDGTGWIWQIASPGHPKAIAHTEIQQRKGLRKQRQIEQAQVNGKKYIAEDRDVADQKSDNVAWIVSRIVGWNKPVTIKDISTDPLEYSDESVTKILVHPKMGWLFTQLIEVVTEDRSFTKTSAKA